MRIVLEEFRSPPLQVVEVRRVPAAQEQVPVATVATAQGGVERVTGTDQLLGVDELVAQPFEVFAPVSASPGRGSFQRQPSRSRRCRSGPNTSS